MKDFKEICKYTGAIIAWVVGGGFATGQEVLRFYSAYGWESYLIITIDLVLFTLIVRSLLVCGFEHKDDQDFHPYKFYCGTKLSKFYYLMVNLGLILHIGMLISAGGTTLNEYYEFNRFLGSVAFAVGLLIVYLSGFNNMVSIISKLGPLVILFVVLVGFYCTTRDLGNFQHLEKSIEALSDKIIGYNWLYSAILYASSNFVASAFYFTALGKHCSSRKVVNISAVLGCGILMLTICMVSSAILLNGETIAAYDVPNVFLATSISPFLSSFVTVLLCLAMFGSSCADVWSFSSQFFKENKRKNQIFATCVLTGCLCFGMLPFSTVLGIIGPVNGIGGFIFMCLVIYKGFSL